MVAAGKTGTARDLAHVNEMQLALKSARHLARRA